MVDTVRTKSEMLATFALNRAGVAMQAFRDLVSSSRFDGGDSLDFTFTAAQVKALRATPQTLVADPGDGFAVIVDAISIAKVAATVFTESADNIVVEYADGTDIMEIETSGFLDAGAAAVVMRPAVAQTALVASSAVQLKNNGDGEFGGTGCSIKVRISYHTVPTT